MDDPTKERPGAGGGDDLSLTRIAVERGLIPAEKAEEYLRRTRDAATRGTPLTVSRLLIDEAGLPPEQVLALVEEQGRRSQGIPDIPRYKILERLGDGATAVVYRAWDADLGRPVAIKVLREMAGMSEIARQRFRREAQVAAGISHPNVVAVHDVGEVGGRLYLVMELIEGRPMSEVLRYNRGDDRALLKLLEKAARGVASAHARGIVHRDLKPANILVTASGEPKVGDFGLAHMQDTKSELTKTGATLGTPLYMAPEQVEGRSRDVTLRTDVYALGAILYEILTGRPPHFGETTVEIYGKIVSEEPVPPRRANPRLSRDVETISLKALEKAPIRRYLDAQEFAEDLRRLLDGEPIRARPVGGVGRLVRWSRRRPALAALLAVSLLAATALVVGSLWYGARVSAALRLAEEQRSRAETERAEARKQEAEARRQAELADRARADTELRLAEGLVFEGDALTLGGRWADAKDRYRKALQLFDKLRVSDVSARLGLWECDRRCPPALRTFAGHSGAVRAAAWSPDGSLAVSRSEDRTLKLWDPKTGRERRTLRGHARVVRATAFSPDGRFVLSVSEDRTLKLWDVQTGETVRTFQGHSGLPQCAALSPDGRRALSGGDDRDPTLRLWDVADGRELGAWHGHRANINAVTFSPDGKVALSAAGDQTLRLWDVGTGRQLREWRGHKDAILDAAFFPDGRRVLSSSWDGTLKIWEIESGRETATLAGHGGAVWSVAVSGDGRLAASASQDLTVKVWDTATGKEIRSFIEHASAVRTVAFSPDGRMVLSASADHTLKLWPLWEGPEVRRLIGHEGVVRRVFVEAGGWVAVSTGNDSTVRLWDLASGRALGTLPTGGVLRSAALSRDGGLLVTGDDAGNLKFWDVATGREETSLPAHQGAVRHLAISPDASLVLSGGDDFALKLWDVTRRLEIGSLPGPKAPLKSLAFSPDGRFALSASGGRDMRTWEIGPRRQARSFGLFARPAPGGARFVVSGALFSPDGTRVLTVGFDRTLRLWAPETGREVAVLAGHTGPVNAAVFSADGAWVVSGGDDGFVKLWDVAAAREIRSFAGHEGSVSCVALSPDGRFIVSGSADGTVRVWDLRAGERYAENGPARAASGKPSDGPESALLLALGTWDASRNLWDWALESLDRARREGAPVPALLLARSAWEAGDLDGARRALETVAAAGETSSLFLGLCRDALNRHAVPDEEGFIRSWLLLDPIPLDGSAGDPETLRGFSDKTLFTDQESSPPRPGRAFPWAGRWLAWQPHFTAGPALELNHFATLRRKPLERSLFVGVVYLRCDEEMPDLKLAIGSDDGSAWWLNGKQLVNVPNNRPLSRDQDVSGPVRLLKGWNVLKMAVLNDTGHAGACARFLDPAGRPVRNLGVSLSPGP